RKYMRQDPAVNLMLASKYASIANYWKYFIGQTEQLKRLNVINDKKSQEKDFLKWSQQTGAGYDNLMNDFATIYKDYKPYVKHSVYLSEGITSSSLGRLAYMAYGLEEALNDKKTTAEDIKKLVNAI